MRAPRTPLSLGSGRSGFSQRPASLGVKLPLLPPEAHRRAEAALSLGPRSVNRAFPAAISLGPGDFETFHSPPSVNLTGCTQSSPGDGRDAAGALGPPPGDHFVETRAPSPPTLRPALPDSGNGSWRRQEDPSGPAVSWDAAAPLPLSCG